MPEQASGEPTFVSFAVAQRETGFGWSVIQRGVGLGKVRKLLIPGEVMKVCLEDVRTLEHVRPRGGAKFVIDKS